MHFNIFSLCKDTHFFCLYAIFCLFLRFKHRFWKVKRFATLFLTVLMGMSLMAQITTDAIMDMVETFGSNLPQEKVYVHMDNTGYYLGDTIYYKAYVMRSDKNTISTLSGVLYVELLDADGYLVERQICKLRNGMANGQFVLETGKAHYAGYYELRAYTRWMLNFGRRIREHEKGSEDWFVRKHMAKEFYVDYDKLYSRTFPVWDKPYEAGERFHDMTMRPMQRLFGKAKDVSKTVINVYPEGGYMVEGLPCRLYYEAGNEAGRHLSGKLVITNAHGDTIAESNTQHAGKGVCRFVSAKGDKLNATFTDVEGTTYKVKMPDVQKEGVTLMPCISDGHLQIDVRHTDGVSGAICIMHQGRVVYRSDMRTTVIPVAQLPQGVLDIVAFDTNGHIYADRLVFNKGNLKEHRLDVIQKKNMVEYYEPYSAIDLTIRRAQPNGKKAVVSVSVMDGGDDAMNADNASMMVEMLLSSEIRGFVENPGYYFESDDEVRNEHLDLLMATQGWRRFSFKTQMMPGMFFVSQRNEPSTPRIEGAVYKYEAIRKADPYAEANEEEIERMSIFFNGGADQSDQELSAHEKSVADFQKSMAEHYGSVQGEAFNRYMKNPGNLKREVNVHAEFVQPGTENMIGDVLTDSSMFTIEQPAFEERFYMHLAAADLSREEKKKTHKKHSWVLPDEGEYAEFYVRVNDPFPRHAHPYSFYRTVEYVTEDTIAKQAQLRDQKFDDRIMTEVVVRKGRNMKRSFDSKHPALVMDAYEAYNMVCDAGLCPGQFVGAKRFVQDIARLVAGDMGIKSRYKVIVRHEGYPESRFMTESELMKYDKLCNLDSVFIYTDFAPRLAGNVLWDGGDQPDVTVDLHLYPNSQRQVTYRDRFYLRQGFNVVEDFYQPDYSKAIPAERTDHRRTLLWLPNVMLDENGEADIKAWNNSRNTRVKVSVNGVDMGGVVLSN